MDEIRGLNQASAAARTRRSQRASSGEGTARDEGTRRPSPDAGQRAADLFGASRARQEPTEEIRASQARVSQLQHERRQLRNEAEQAQALRAVATEAADPGISQSRRQELVARFEQIRAALRDVTLGRGSREGSSPSATPDAPEVTPTTPETTTPEATAPQATAPTEGITISGNIRATSGETDEDRVNLEESIVASERGIVAVRIDSPDEGVSFRFEDSGNGQVRATRYETRDGQQMLVDSQTLSVTGAGDNTGQGTPQALSFDRLGLQLDLGADYTPGDLQYVEISAGSSSQQQVQATRTTTITQAETLTIQSTSSAQDAATALEQALAQISQQEQILTQALDTEAAALVPFLDSLAGMTGDLTQSLLGTGGGGNSRDAILRDLATTLMAQDDLSSERVLQLLA